MSSLRTTLLAKIWLTLVLWCVPLLFFPSGLLEWIGFRNIGSLIFLKLLGMAYLSLVVGYYFGYLQLMSGVYPAKAVCVGIVSNAGACFILVGGALVGAWADWGLLAKSFMWFSLAATGALSCALYVYGAKKHGFRPVKIT